VTAAQPSVPRPWLPAAWLRYRKAIATGIVGGTVAAAAGAFGVPGSLAAVAVALAVVFSSAVFSSAGSGSAASGAGSRTSRVEAGDGGETVLHQLARTIQAEAGRMTGSIEQLSAEANSISFNSMMQAGASESARDSLSEISTTVGRVSELAGETEARSRQVSELAARGEGLAQSAVAEMDRLSAAIHRIEQRVDPLVEHSSAIGVSAELITGIARQTRLLSLNATIESVRAGDRGAGFAVVAEEVRKLADESSVASRQITSAISAIQEGTATVAAGITDAVEVVRAGMQHVNQTFEVLVPIRREANETLERNSEIVSAASGEVELTSTAVDAVSQVLQVAGQTDLVVNQALATSMAMSEATDGILSAISPWIARPDSPTDSPTGSPPDGSGQAKAPDPGASVDYAAMYGIDLSAGDPLAGNPFGGSPFAPPAGGSAPD
jgi:methyl-accepting chemotaxis protein